MRIIKNAVMAVIPARSGSKGVVHKNVRPLGGHPLLAWSVMAARRCKDIDRVLVSTDSSEYAAIAREYGAETPFLRPARYATDDSRDIDFFMHALEFLLEHENGAIPEYLVHLRPTIPLRDPAPLSEAIAMIKADSIATSLCSASETRPPSKYFTLNPDGSFSALFGEEQISLPRQQCFKAYDSNGYVDILKSENILRDKSLYGSRRLAFICDHPGDIDTEDDFRRAEDSRELPRIGKLLFDDFSSPGAGSAKLFSVAGKNVLLTGAAGGLGNAFLRGFLEGGARVFAATRRNDTDWDGLRNRFGAELIPVRCDLSDEKQVAALADRVEQEPGGCDVLVNNAFGCPHVDSGHYDIALLRETMAVGLEAAYLLCGTIAPAMARRGGGSIINITSINAEQAFPGNPAYVTTKSALRFLTLLR